jgi:hypothetical protein
MASDIVALMTFEHQTQMTNRITRLGWLARMGRGPSDRKLRESWPICHSLTKLRSVNR